MLVVSEDGVDPEAVGGMELRGRELVDRFTTRFDVSVLTKRACHLGDGRSKRLDVVTPGPALAWVRDRVSWSLGSAAFDVSIRRTVRSLLRQLQPEVIWLNKFSLLPAAAVSELVAYGAPTVAWLGDRTAGPTLERALGTGRRTDHVHFVFNCDFLRRFYALIVKDRPNQIVIRDGVDARRFRPADTPVAERRFVFCGRTTREKGYVTFCRLVAALPSDLVDGIDIIGDGPALQEGLDVLRRAHRQHRLRHAGPAGFSTVHERLRAGSIFLFPSLDEGFPAAVLEAMSCGLTVIASDVGGTGEAVRDGDTGMLLRADDFTGFLRSCERAANDATLRARLGSRARARVVAEFGLDRKLMHIDGLVDQALGARAA